VTKKQITTQAKETLRYALAKLEDDEGITLRERIIANGWLEGWTVARIMSELTILTIGGGINNE